MQNKTKVIWGLIIFLLLIIGYKAFLREEKPETVKIGVIAPRTGLAASIGEWMVEGVELALQEINAAGGIHGQSVELVIEDDQCNGKKGVDAYQKLHALSGINYFVGPLCSASRVPTLEAAKNDKTVLITTGLALVTSPVTTAYTFNVLPSAWSVMQKILDFGVTTLAAKKISFLYVDDEYGKENHLATLDFLNVPSRQLVTVEKFTRGTADLRTQILKLKNDNSEVVAVVGYGPDYAVFLKQAKELGLTKPILATSNIQVPEASVASQQTGQTVYYSYPAVSNFQSVITFAEKYRRVKPDAPAILPMYIGSGYDALKILVGVLENCELDDSGCVKVALTQTNNYEGANGLISFDEKGNNSAGSAIEIRTLKNGEFGQVTP